MNCCKNDVTGGGVVGGNGENNNGNIRITKYNFEATQTNTQATKEFLEKYKEYKIKYPKAELMLYYRGKNYTSDSVYSKYYFDNDANITNIYINGSGNKETNYKFWGMLPDNPQIACYYYDKNNGEFGIYYSLMHENGLIKNKSRIFNNGGVYEDEDLVKKIERCGIKIICNPEYHNDYY